jgi:transcriptional regulator with XRE-family HTH domain
VEIAQKIKDLRLKREIPQQDAAAHMGLTRQTYALVESGKKDLTLPELEKLAGFLRTSIAELLYGPRIIDEETINSAKLETIIMMCLEFGGNEWHSMLKHKLCQMVYLIDVEWYRKTNESMLNRNYFRFFNGPAIEHFYWVLDGLYELGRVQIDYRGGQIVVSATESAAQGALTPAERLFVKNIAEHWHDRPGAELSSYVARQLNWKYKHVGAYVPYDLLKPNGYINI